MTREDQKQVEKVESDELSELRYPIASYLHINIAKIKLMGDMLITQYPTEELTLICRGSSGAIIGSQIALLIGERCKMLHVKKEGENCHSGKFNNFSEAIEPQRKLIIVDDLIATGSTVNIIVSEMDKHIKETNKNVGYERDHVEIDALCVTGYVKMSQLKFIPKVIIAKRIS